MKYNECKKLCETVFMKIKAYSTDARNVTLMIIAHESGQGKHRRQIGADEPALGLAQIERRTFYDILKNSDRIKSYLTAAGYKPDAVLFEHIETDDVLCLIFVRARLAMDPRPLPVTPVAQSEFCKRFWNGGGKASAEKYLNDWEKWRNE